MGIRTNILLRVYIAFGLVMLFAGAVVVQLIRVQFIQGPAWRKKADSIAVRYIKVDAARGNIYSADGSLLATSVPEYELHMNMMAPGIASDEVFNSKVDSLAMQLSKYFGDKSEREYARMLRDGHANHSKYLLLNKRAVSFAELKKIRKFAMINLGKYSGGLMPEYQNKRVLPFHTLAARTIGYKNANVKNAVGLEGAYADYINGESGKRLVQYISGNAWMPINDEEEIAPKDGADIISTIDVNLQDVAQDALKKQLIASAADHGCVVLMEVATGHIKAIANFTRTKDGNYEERLNYAVGYPTEPGSTFKLATYMALLDHHKIDTTTKVDGEGGKAHVIPGNNKYTVTDVEHNGVISAKNAFEFSSNVAAAKFTYNHYKDNPAEYTSQLYSYHLNERLGLQIPGEGYPLIKTPKSKSWSKLSLPQMAYGYEEKLTPLQLLAFYNAVANGGKKIAPLFVSEIRRYGSTVEHFEPRVITPKICSDETLAKLRGMLEGVVAEGNCKRTIKNPLYSVAGKTGTAQIANGASGYGEKKNHQASFCGYFPADKPKYSMIVVISNPTQGSYLAALVAGPVFRAIADRVYAGDLEINQNNNNTQHLVGNTTPPNIKQGNKTALKQVYGKLGIKSLYASANTPGVDTSDGIAYQDASYKRGTVPVVTGMGLSDALYVLGNAGYKVSAKGSGKVVNQSVTGGSIIPVGSKITIELE